MASPKWDLSTPGIQAFEKHGTRQETQDGFDSRCEVQVMVAWADRYTSSNIYFICNNITHLNCNCIRYSK